MTPITAIKLTSPPGLAITATWNTARTMSIKTGPTGSRWRYRILQTSRRTRMTVRGRFCADRGIGWEAES